MTKINYRVVRQTMGIHGKYFRDGRPVLFDHEDAANDYAEAEGNRLACCYQGRTYLAVYQGRTFVREYRVRPNQSPLIFDAMPS